jgi:hypothetical protein
MRTTLFIVLVAVAVGCKHSASQQGPPNGDALDEARVLAIARATVMANDSWINRAEFEKPIRNPDGSWTILVWRRPVTPGGHRFVTIDAEGRVTEYLRGR